MEIETGDAGAWQRAPAFFYSSKLKDRLAMNKLLIPAFCVLALLLAACGGGGSKSTSESGASVGLLVGDAPTDSLSSATLTITELRLVRENLQLTSNLLAAPRTLDVLGLGVLWAGLGVLRLAARCVSSRTRAGWSSRNWRAASPLSGMAASRTYG